MKNKFLISLITISFFSILLLLPLGSSFMPKCTHRIIFEESLKDPMNSNLYIDCMKNKPLCYASQVLADVTVISYYTNKGLYGLTHSPQFCSAMINNVAKVPGLNIDDARAISAGACMHQPADIASHSRQNKDGTGEDGLVPYAIKHSLIVNEISHVFAEQKIDNEICAKYPELEQTSITMLEENYKKAQPLFELSMLGLDSSIDKNQLNEMFNTFIQETLNYQGYKPAYDQKSFLGSFQVIPLSYLAIFFILFAGIILVNTMLILKIFKRQNKIRHYIGLIVFIPLLLIMIYLTFGATQGSAFNNFLSLINPIVKYVPTGDTQTYIDNGIANTKGLLTLGEGWLDGTDASGRGQIPVLDEANAQVLYYDYAILIGIVLFFVWYIWYLLKKNKVINSNGWVGLNL